MRLRILFAVVLPIALAAGCTDEPTAAGSGGRSLVAAQPTYSPALNSSLDPSVVFVGVPLVAPTGSCCTVGFAINDAGLIVGAHGGNGIAAVWSSPSTPLSLGQLDGRVNCCSHFFGVNSLGDVVGNSSNSPTNGAQMWIQATGERRFLGNGGFANVIALDINDSRDVVGEATFRFPFHIPDGGTLALMATAPYSFGVAGRINNSGTVVGRVYNIPASPPDRAVVWSSPTAAPTLLPNPGGDRSSALGINEAGDIVGYSETVPGDLSTRHAVLWPATGGRVDLRNWPNACPGFSEARMVNDRGIILGRCNNLPVLWSAAFGMRLLPGTTENEPHGLNNRNQVVGRFGTSFPANSAPVAIAGGPYTGAEGSVVVLQFGGSDADGDALQYSWDMGDGTTGSGASPPPHHTYADNGTYAIRLTVTDPAGEHDTRTTLATIANVAPSVGAITAPVGPEPVGALLEIAFAFDDPGVLDSHAALVEWGDGTSASILLGNATSPVALARAYTSAGVYRIGVTVTDKDGGVGTRTYEYVVVYDSGAGFVSGGGWIESPAGACLLTTACGDAVGRATFGFFARYQRGANRPDGNTQFQFRAGGIAFHSSEYEWLVVAGSRAQFKGSGTINNNGAYGFLLTAIDGALPGGGQVDRFRIKIWDRTTGSVVYDNEVGVSDASDPGTRLGGGSVVIHR